MHVDLNLNTAKMRKHKFAPSPLPTQKRLLELFTYFPDEGVIKLNETGEEAFTECHSRFSYAASQIIDGKDYVAHRVIWAMIHGDEIQPPTIGFRDGNKTNLKLDNLMIRNTNTPIATRDQAVAAMGKLASIKDEPELVAPKTMHRVYKSGPGFMVNFVHNNTRHYFGYFTDVVEACKASDAAVLKYGAPGAPLNFPHLKDTYGDIVAKSIVPDKRRARKQTKPVVEVQDNTKQIAYHGVRRVHKSDNYYAVVSYKGTRFYLGTFKMSEDAARAYDAMAVHLRGVAAKTNFTYTDTSEVGKPNAVTVTLAGKKPMSWKAYKAHQKKIDKAQGAADDQINAEAITTPISYRGVRPVVGTPNFGAMANYNGTRFYMGTFRTAEAAARAYDAMVVYLRGDEAKTNFEYTEASPADKPHAISVTRPGEKPISWRKYLSLQKKIDKAVDRLISSMPEAAPIAPIAQPEPEVVAPVAATAEVVTPVTAPEPASVAAPVRESVFKRVWKAIVG